jgi:3-carboxy-cis,cis-muconate cycloisomerase
MIDFERELAASQADIGLVPRSAADAIAAGAARLSRDVELLGRAGRDAGNPVGPLVRALEEASGEDAARFVHFGATSQDVMDTAAMVVGRRAGGIIIGDLIGAAEFCARLADGHRHVVMVGRTLLQHALPTTFGLKAAGWLVGLTDAAANLSRVLTERLALQLGGAAGTAASLGPHAPAITARLGDRLGLRVPPMPWHTDRVRPAELAAALAIVAGTGSKVALDVILLGQSEVAEVLESSGAGHGVSSTMPHKHNAIDSVTAVAAARRAVGLSGIMMSAMSQEHERAAGAWHAEWQTLTELIRASGGVAAHVRSAMGSLTVDADRMYSNLMRTRGAIMSERVMLDLTPELGRTHARQLVGGAVRRALEEDRSLREVLDGEKEVTACRTSEQLDVLCDPVTYLGTSDQSIDNALAQYESYRASSGREA